MLNPHNPVGKIEDRAQSAVNFCLGQRLVAVGSRLAVAREEDSALTVGVDGSSLKNEVGMILQGTVKDSGIIESDVDGIVEVGLELLAPPVELKVEHVVGYEESTRLMM